MKRDATGTDQIKQAVFASAAAEQRVAEAEAALAKARGEYQAAEAHLEALVASGACVGHAPPGKTNGKPVTTNGVQLKPVKAKPLYALSDNSVPKVWRIAFALLADPIIDYQATAEALWGPCDKTVAKNRVGAHLTQLKKLGVIEALGSNTYRVNKAKLAEHSGLPVEAPV